MGGWTDNPGAFSNVLGDDLYVNPWWALRKRLCDDATAFVTCMDRVLGPPDLWFQGLFHELLWGPRDLHRLWRPGFHANLSGQNGELWCTFWLPWRAGQHGYSPLQVSGVHRGLPMAANVVHHAIDFETDVVRMHGYAAAIPQIRELARGLVDGKGR